MNENLMFKAIQLLGGEQLYQAVNLIYTALEAAYEQGRQDGVEDVQVNAGLVYDDGYKRGYFDGFPDGVDTECQAWLEEDPL